MRDRGRVADSAAGAGGVRAHHAIAILQRLVENRKHLLAGETEGVTREIQELRFADKRTRLKTGTIPWYEENHTFRVPKGTRYVAVSCILGSDGRAWFDNVQLSVPETLDWQTRKTKNFTFYWLENRPFPVGSIESQQKLFD